VPETTTGYMLLSLPHLSCSIVDSARARELVCLHVVGVDVRFSDSAQQRRLRMEVESFQVP
jgi:hypothetical protein